MLKDMLEAASETGHNNKRWRRKIHYANSSPPSSQERRYRTDTRASTNGGFYYLRPCLSLVQVTSSISSITEYLPRFVKCLWVESQKETVVKDDAGKRVSLLVQPREGQHYSGGPWQDKGWWWGCYGARGRGTEGGNSRGRNHNNLRGRR